MMIFSATYSARLSEQRQPDQDDHDGRRWRDYWVQRGVTAHGEIWSANFEQRLEREGVRTSYVAQDHDSTAADVVAESDDEGLGASIQSSKSSSHGSQADESAGELVHTSFPQPPLPPTNSSIMASKTPLWISLWFLITVPVIFWDAGYCFLRPRSMRGGDLHWIWTPYALYQDIDYVYGLRAFENNEGFTNAQSFMNIVENFMNIAYLYLTHVAQSPLAPLIGFTSITMTLSKTILYWLNEYYCGGCSVGHNDLTTLVVYWIIPNGIWLVVPTIVLYKLGKDLATSLRTVDRLEKKKASGKRQ